MGWAARFWNGRKTPAPPLRAVPMTADQANAWANELEKTVIAEQLGLANALHQQITGRQVLTPGRAQIDPARQAILNDAAILKGQAVILDRLRRLAGEESTLRPMEKGGNNGRPPQQSA